jgi:hypothetical protein
VGETLVANITLKILRPHVDLLVVVEGARLAEGLVAHVALERPLAAVHPPVLDEVLLLVERLVARLAHVGPHALGRAARLVARGRLMMLLHAKKTQTKKSLEKVQGLWKTTTAPGILTFGYASKPNLR